MFYLEDRYEAGRKLYERFGKNFGDDFLVCGILRGGLLVAYKFCSLSRLKLFALATKKVGHPKNEELAVGALSPDGSFYLNERFKGAFDRETLKSLTERALREIKEREKIFKLEYPNLEGRGVLLIDDGCATGYTAIASLKFLKKKGAKDVFLLTPVIPEDTFKRLKGLFEEVLTLFISREEYFAVGMYYKNFKQVSDQEVKELIDRAKREGLWFKIN